MVDSANAADPSSLTSDLRSNRSLLRLETLVEGEFMTTLCRHATEESGLIISFLYSPRAPVVR